MNQETENTPAGLFRRLGALLYDSLLVIAVLFGAASIALAVYKSLGYAEKGITPSEPYYNLYIVYLASVVYLFFGWFWTHGGQTLGMRAWRLRVVRLDGHSITWLQSAIRLILGVTTLGVGLFWALINKNGQSLYDLITHTRVVVISKNSSR